MSGHSKWSKVKHQKATTDVVKAAAFTKASHAITIAVREGGGVTNPEANFRLRLAIEKARDVNMPKENIERAIAKGIGVGGQAIESMFYEGYGPGGVAFIIEAATDNRQRTAGMVKNVLDRFGGTLTGPGSVLFLFTKTPSGAFVLRLGSGIALDEENRHAVTRLEEALRELPDVLRVYTNLS